ncbi:MAG TPA: gliding motility-associated C-terminal domain-containing protein [Cyclobacteriaceae bacterium]|nr:gliding motility-associated C-terminal domain-containing protein [Cyclobacteriaceae bacterium]
MIGMCKGVVVVFLMFLAGHTLLAAPPIHYVENKNQWPAGFHFGAEFPNTRVFLKDASLYFIQYRQTVEDGKSPKSLQTTLNESHVHGAGELASTTFELTFVNALRPSIVASGKKKTLYNYYHGNDPSAWGQGAHAFGEVIYQGMYEGIDLRVYSEGDRMKYDWIISPCSDPREIRFAYKGIEHLDLVDENLVIKSKLGEVVETKPFAYQMVNGERRMVPASFDIDNGEVTFVFPQGYDTSYELVIDPFLIFSSYSGSTLDNWGNAATPDSNGNLYSGGMVSGTPGAAGFPTTPGSYDVTHNGGTWDVGILKYDSIGANVLYVTYLGGDGVETPQSLVVNSNDELLILGATSSENFPGALPNSFKGGTTVDPLNGVEYIGGTDLFIARLSIDGRQLLASTYLGGSSNDGINFVSGYMADPAKVESPLSKNYGDQLRGDIITDADGFVYIASNTRSQDFPVANADPMAQYHGGTHDAVVAKLTPGLSLVWTRLMGGSSTDIALSIKIAASGSIFVAGGTASTNMDGMNGFHATAPGNIDGWIAELSPGGDKIINSTYVGTSSYDQVYFIDLATNGDVLAYGQTKGAYPVSSGVYSKLNAGQFLHRFKPDLKSSVFSTTFGKSNQGPDISPTAFLVNACDNIYMAGWGGVLNSTFSGGLQRNYLGGNTKGMAITADAWQSTTSGNDFYFMVLSGDGTQLIYGTYLGGSSSSTHVDGGTSRFDKRGIVYHAVCASCGGRTNDFPSFNVPLERSQNRSSNCNNAAFKFDLSSLRAGIQTNNVKLTNPGYNKICLPDTIVFQNTSIGGEIFEWNFGDGPTQTVIDRKNILHRYKKPGRYTVRLKAIDRSTCVGEDSTTSVVDAFLPDMHAGPDQDICTGSSTHLIASGGAVYAWKNVDNSFTSALKDPLITPTDTTDYYVTMTDINGCVRKDTVTVSVVPGMDLAFEYERYYDCHTRPYVKVKNLSELKDGETTAFFFGDGNSIAEDEATYSYDRDGIYTISLRGTKEFCVYQVSEQVRFVTLKIPNVITPGEEDGLNDAFKIVYGDPPVLKDGLEIGLKIMNRWGVRVYESDNYRDDWRGADIDGGVYYYEIDIRGEVQCKGWIHLIK